MVLITDIMVGLVALLPLLQHHRGWTHRWWAVPLVPGGVLLIWSTLSGGEGVIAALRSMTWEEAAALLPFYLAMVAGYGLHLLIDGLVPRPSLMGLIRKGRLRAAR